MEQLINLLGYEFVQNAIAAGVVVAIVSGVVSREDTERGAKITVTPDNVANGDEDGPVEELYQLPRRTIVLVRSEPAGAEQKDPVPCVG